MSVADGAVGIPTWIQILQASLTPAIATAVGVIAFMQWRTAHQKVMLDLFDRRWAVYKDVEAFLSLMISKGVRQDIKDLGAFHRVRTQAQFLFGADVHDLLARVHLAAINMSTYAAQFEHLDVGPERTAHVSAAHDEMKSLLQMSQNIEAVFADYMRMDQKRVRTPMEYIRDRNHQRLSYADEKQK